MRLNIHGLIDNAKCYEMVRRLRWAEGVECPHCHAPEIIKNGHDNTQPERQRYLCRMCNRSFDDLTGTVLRGTKDIPILLKKRSQAPKTQVEEQAWSRHCYDG